MIEYNPYPEIIKTPYSDLNLNEIKEFFINKTLLIKTLHKDNIHEMNGLIHNVIFDKDRNCFEFHLDMPDCSEKVFIDIPVCDVKKMIECDNFKTIDNFVGSYHMLDIQKSGATKCEYEYSLLKETNQNKIELISEFQESAEEILKDNSKLNNFLIGKWLDVTCNEIKHRCKIIDVTYQIQNKQQHVYIKTRDIHNQDYDFEIPPESNDEILANLLNYKEIVITGDYNIKYYYQLLKETPKVSEHDEQQLFKIYNSLIQSGENVSFSKTYDLYKTFKENLPFYE